MPSSLHSRRRYVLGGAVSLMAAIGAAALLLSNNGARTRVATGHPPTSATSTATRPPGTRSPARLFAPTSVWNSEIPTDAQVDPSSPAMVNALDAEVTSEIRSGIGPWISTTEASTPIYVVGSHQPTMRVQLDQPTLSWRVALQRAFEAVPVPADARPATGQDAVMTVWQPSTDKLWEFFQMRREPNGWHAAWGGAIQNVSRSPGYYAASSWPGASTGWGATATSLPAAAGIITLADLRSGAIDHAVSVALPAPRAGVYAWPAERSDGTGGPDSIPEGARLRLDPNLDLNSLDLPPMTRMIAKAAQRYGIVVVNQTHYGIGFSAEDPTRYGGNRLYYGAHGFFDGMTPQQLLARFPWSRLQVLKLQLSSSKVQ